MEKRVINCSLRSFLVVLVYFFLCFSYLNAQETSYNIGIQRYTMSDGLSHQHVYQTYEDSRGFIWVVTSKGLDFFNGNRFVEVLQWPTMENPEEVHIETEDKKGNLWIRRKQNRSLVFQLVQLKTLQVSTPQFVWPNLSAQCNDVSVLPGGDLLITDVAGGFWVLGEQQSPKFICQLPSGPFRILDATTSSEQVWIRVDKPLHSDSELKLLNLRNGEIQSTVTVEAKNSFFTTGGTDLSWLDAEAIHSITSLGRRSFTIPSSVSLRCSWDRVVGADPKSGNLWLYGKDELLVFHPEQGVLHDFAGYFTKIPAFGNVFQIYVDSRQVVWVSSINGLYQIDFRPSVFQRLLWNDPAKSANPFINSCRGILEHSSGRILINYSTQVGMLESSNLSTVWNRRMEVPYFGVAEDQDGSILLGGLNNRLVRMDPKTGTFISLVGDKKEAGNLIWAIFPTKNRIWLGLDQGFGWLDRGSKQIVYLTSDGSGGAAAELSASSVYHIQAASNGNGILLGTSVGLFELDSDGTILHRYWKAGSGASYLPADNIRHFSKDLQGNYWLATAEGLVKWTVSTGEKRLFGTKEGLPNVNLYAVYPDHNGVLWMSSDNGIIQFEPSTASLHYYLPKEGVTHQEFNRISHLMQKSGRLWFGSVNGVTIFRPEQLVKDPTAIRKTALAVQQATVLKDRSVEALSILPQWNSSGALEIEPGARLIRIKLAHSDYLNKGLIRFSFHIEGLMAGWQEAENDLIQMAGLPPGNYQLRVRTSLGSGYSTNSELIIPLQVKAPLYAQVWFWLLLFSIIGLLVFFFIRIRWKYLKDKQVELEFLVDRRTQKVEQARQLIAEQSDHLTRLAEEKVRFFNTISHEFRAPIALIMGAVRNLQKEMGENTKFGELLGIAQRNSQRLMRLVNEVATVSATEKEEIQVKRMPVNLVEFCEDLVLETRRIAGSRQVVMECQPPVENGLYLATDPSILDLIVSQLLSNALRYTPEQGLIKLSIHHLQEESSIQLVVSDPGPGIPSEEIFHLFERSYRSEMVSETGVSLLTGMSLIKEMTSLLGGTITVEGEAGQGNRIVLQFPMNNQENKSFFQPGGQETLSSKHPLSGTFWEEKKPTLLIIEANPDFKVLFQKMFRQLAKVELVNDGLEALTILESNSLPELIITDVELPGMDGFRLLEELKSRPVYSEIPVVVYSSKSKPGEEQKALELGASEYLIKPASPELLEWTVRRLLLSRHPEEVSSLVQFTPLNTLTEEEERWVQLLDQIVSEHLSEQSFSVDFLAQKMLMGRTQFFQTVQAYTGMTPNAYIKEARLQKAKRMLESSEFDSIKEIAEKVGWRDVSYFTKLYKTRFGKTPVSYMNKP